MRTDAVLVEKFIVQALDVILTAGGGVTGRDGFLRSINI
jgi:hypothetical protein